MCPIFCARKCNLDIKLTDRENKKVRRSRLVEDGDGEEEVNEGRAPLDRTVHRNVHAVQRRQTG